LRTAADCGFIFFEVYVLFTVKTKPEI